MSCPETCPHCFRIGLPVIEYTRSCMNKFCAVCGALICSVAKPAHGWLSIPKIIALVLVASSVMCSAQNARVPIEHDISVVGMGNITTPSLGVFSNYGVIWQGNQSSAGIGAYSENWKRNNGLVAGGSYTRTNSTLYNLQMHPEGSWALDRYKLDVVYEHRFRVTKVLQPYLGLGTYGVILWGGPAPAHSGVNHSGLDGWAGLIVPGGVNFVLSRRMYLKAGLFVDIGKASTYGDTTYTSSQTIMYEPQLGLIFKLGK